MKKVILTGVLLAMAGVGLMAGSAMATAVNVTGANGESTLNQIFTANNWTINANSDQLTNDAYWQIAEQQSGAWASMIIEISAGSSSNTFGIYDGAGHAVQLMDGAANAGDKVAITMTGTLLSAAFYDNGALDIAKSFSNVQFSTVFGFYLGNANGPLFYSDATKNSDSADHMVSYAGTGANGLSVGHHILAFEDTASSNWDWDYNDMVLMVESVKPVPEPATMLLFGTGIASLAGVIRRRRNK
jgi:hypothetical protein